GEYRRVFTTSSAGCLPAVSSAVSVIPGTASNTWASRSHHTWSSGSPANTWRRWLTPCRPHSRYDHRQRCCSPVTTPCRPNNTEPYFVANRRGEHSPPLGKHELVAVIRSSCALPYVTFS